MWLKATLLVPQPWLQPLRFLFFVFPKSLKKALTPKGTTLELFWASSSPVSPKPPYHLRIFHPEDFVSPTVNNKLSKTTLVVRNFELSRIL